MKNNGNSRFLSIEQICPTYHSFQVLEEDVVESHKNLVDSMEHWIQQDASLLAMTNEVDYDQDGEPQRALSYSCQLQPCFHSVRPAAWGHDCGEAGAAGNAQGQDQGLQVWSLVWDSWMIILILHIIRSKMILFAGSVCQRRRFRARRWTRIAVTSALPTPTI